MKQILLPTDFSENSLNAILYAIDMYRGEKCRFILLNAFKVNGYDSESKLSAIPDNISTSEEFEIIKRHPEDGYVMVSEAGHVSQIALDIVRLHHERLDGGGYPLGLAGDSIPRHVRIVTIADVYDAMTSNRAYRDARSPETALKVIYEQRGLHLDESFATQFIRCIGIFPVGSVVELDTGAIGLVVASSVNAHLQPTVLLLRTPDGEAYEKRLLINLAGEDQDLGRFGRRIARGVDPTEAGIDIAGVVSEEFGLEAG